MTITTAPGDALVAHGPTTMLIDGAWVASESGRHFDAINPSSGQTLARVPLGCAADVDRAVAAARRALEGPWSRATPADRQAVLWRMADLLDARFEDLATLDSLEFGGPIARTRGARDRAVGLLRYYSAQARQIHGDTVPTSLPGDPLALTLKEPVGVVGAIVPWNGPMGSTFWKVAPAIAAGCTVVLKPSEHASLMLLRFGALALEAGLPPGVLNVVTGDGEAGQAIAEHPDVDKVAFTGSTRTGQAIIRASASNVKRLTLELGGKSPQIVFADADLEAAVPAVAMAAFANSGQLCSAGSRLLVEASVHDELVERVMRFTEGLRVGDSLDPSTDLGPLVSEGQLRRVLEYLEAGRAEGAQAVMGGGRLGGDLADGYFVGPTIFTDVADGMRVAREEIFGPVLTAMAFRDEEEAIRRANDTPFGLAAGVWTSSIDRARRVSRALRAGTVWVNCYLVFDAAVPFGGYKMSGYGRESGAEHIEEYLETKSVVYGGGR